MDWGDIWTKIWRSRGVTEYTSTWVQSIPEALEEEQGSQHHKSGAGPGRTVTRGGGATCRTWGHGKGLPCRLRMTGKLGGLNKAVIGPQLHFQRMAQAAKGKIHCRKDSSRLLRRIYTLCSRYLCLSLLCSVTGPWRRPSPTVCVASAIKSNN